MSTHEAQVVAHKLATGGIRYMPQTAFYPHLIREALEQVDPLCLLCSEETEEGGVIVWTE